MYLNNANVTCSIKGIHLIINTENGCVVGVDERGVEEYQGVAKCSDASWEDKELLTFLRENEFIFDKPHESTRVNLQTAYLHVTNKCNLHCLGCYSEDGARNKEKDLNSDEMLHILDELGEAGIVNLVISGGEPLFRKDITDLIQYAKEKCGIESADRRRNLFICKLEFWNWLKLKSSNLFINKREVGVSI